MHHMIPWRRSEERGVSDLFSTLQRDMNRLFENFAFTTPRWDNPAVATAFYPKVDIAEGPEAFEIIAELPGMQEKDIHCTLTGNMLTLRGEKKVEKEEKKKEYYSLERSYGAFERTFNLPADVEPGKVSAKMKDGVLNIMVPKTMSAQKSTKTITIQGS